MKVISIIYYLCLIFLFIKNAQAKIQPIENLTFLINQVEDDDEFYHDLFSGFEQSKAEGFLKNFKIVNYHNNPDELENALQQSLMNSQAIVINLHHASNLDRFAELTHKKNIPLIFVFRKPSEKFLAKYPNVYYISQDNIQSGVTQGLLVSKFLNKYPTIDKNKDKKIALLNIGGSFSSSERNRVDWLMNTINNYPGNILQAEEILRLKGNYSYKNVFDDIKNIISQNDEINRLEIIVSQSENMARAAADALAGTEYEDIPIFSRGISSTGRDEILNDRLKGTTVSFPNLVSYYASRLAYNYINHLDMNTDIPYLIHKKKIELPYEIITKDELIK